MRYAVIAALPRELQGLTRGLKPDPVWKREGIYLYQRSGALLLAAGMGSLRVTRALEAALQTAQVEQIVSLGLAGACSPAQPPGSVLEPEKIVDARTGEAFSSITGTQGKTLVSTETIASIQEKRRLHSSYGADCVDMEAATLARLAQAHSLPFRAIKGISDAHDFELASLSRFTGKHGHFQTGRFALHTAVRPGTWKHAMQLGRNSQQALAALTARMEDLLRTIG